MLTNFGDAASAVGGCFGCPAYEWRANTIAAAKTQAPAAARMLFAAAALFRADSSSSALCEEDRVRPCPARRGWATKRFLEPLMGDHSDRWAVGRARHSIILQTTQHRSKARLRRG